MSGLTLNTTLFRPATPEDVAALVGQVEASAVAILECVDLTALAATLGTVGRLTSSHKFACTISRAVRVVNWVAGFFGKNVPSTNH